MAIARHPPLCRMALWVRTRMLPAHLVPTALRLRTRRAQESGIRSRLRGGRWLRNQIQGPDGASPPEGEDGCPHHACRSHGAGLCERHEGPACCSARINVRLGG